MTSRTRGGRPYVRREVADGVAALTLDRPDRHNAWSVPMEAELFGLMAEAGDDPEVQAIVVTGAGRSFCPGMDAAALSEQARLGTTTKPHLRPPMTFPTTVPKPVIAAINGACAGQHGPLEALGTAWAQPVVAEVAAR